MREVNKREKMQEGTRIWKQCDENPDAVGKHLHFIRSANTLEILDKKRQEEATALLQKFKFRMHQNVLKLPS